MKLFKHQEANVAHIKANPQCCIFDTCGTGKTISVITGTKDNKGKKLVFAPKSILRPAWGNDFDKFYPEINYVIAEAKNRRAAFDTEAEYYITNIDAAKWVLDNVDLSDFDTFILDESTSIKNPTAVRSKCIAKIAHGMTYRIIMTGTPMPNTIMDLWHQIYVVDEGHRLGKNYHQFRYAVATPIRVGASVHAVRWDPKPGSTEVVSDMIEDIVIRHELEDVLEMPDRIERTVSFDLSDSHRRAYEKLKQDCVIDLMNVVSVTAVHAASLQQKLLQLLSGTVYADTGKPLQFSSDRYELIMDLVEENENPTIVACVWTHQLEKLLELSKKRGIKAESISGKTSTTDRTLSIEAIQNGTSRVLFANIAALSHGVTLTTATRCIFASPTFNAEQFEQFKHRIFRAGQTKKTETILIEASGTLEERVNKILQGKLDRQTTLLELLK